VVYEYPSETHAVMTIVLPDGNSAKTSFDLITTTVGGQTRTGWIIF